MERKRHLFNVTIRNLGHSLSYLFCLFIAPPPARLLDLSMELGANVRGFVIETTQAAITGFRLLKSHPEEPDSHFVWLRGSQ